MKMASLLPRFKKKNEGKIESGEPTIIIMRAIRDPSKRHLSKIMMPVTVYPWWHAPARKQPVTKAAFLCRPAAAFLNERSG
jgi:hypothetical protein